MKQLVRKISINIWDEDHDAMMVALYANANGTHIMVCDTLQNESLCSLQYFSHPMFLFSLITGSFEELNPK